MGKALFIAGTGTDVGKTYVTGLLLKKLNESGLRAGYYKAAMSGNDRLPDGQTVPGDALRVKALSGIDQPADRMCPYVYEAAVSPHLAARLEGNPVRLSRVIDGFKTVCRDYDYVTMEGSGGILCPLNLDGEQLWLAGLVRELGLSCLLVADAGLGVINSAGLTAFYMKAHGIPLKGLILNRFQPGNPMHEDNRRLCEYVTGTKVLACVREGDGDIELSADALAALYGQVRL